MKLIYFSFLLLSLKSFSQEFEVIDYNEAGYLVNKKVVLKDLTSKDSFEGKYFKIVNAKDEEAVKFSNLELSNRAAQVYHHLTVAHAYFSKVKGMNKKHLNQKITIRLEMPNQFDVHGHFAHDSYSPEFNTAITIPASTEARMEEVPSWEREIWFRPMKLITTSKPIDSAVALLKSKEIQTNLSLVFLENDIAMQLSSGISKNIVDTLFTSDHFYYLMTGFVAIKALPIFVRVYGTIFKPKFFLDTAMIPEVVYHEYSHYVLSDYMDLSISPVIEGYANYYAGRISGKARWGKIPKQYTNDQGRNAYTNELYSFRLETSLYAVNSFTYKILWQLQDVFDAETDAFIYRTRKKINKKSDIKNDMVNAFFDEINADDELNTLFNKIKLHDILQRNGI